MAKNVFIDTCTWIELVNSLEYSNQLRQLSTWVDQNEIILFCPEALKEEWAKHRLEKEKKLDLAISNHVKDLKRSKLFAKQPDFEGFEMETAERVLKSQIYEIDRLFSLSVLVEERTEDVLLARRHEKEHKAPFLNKDASHNDAVMVFSTLAELSRRQEGELYFFSANHKEFGDPQNLMTILHPDISGCFPEVRVQYFADLNKGFDHLKEIGLSSGKVAVLKSSSIPNLFALDRKLPIGGQLKHFLDQRFADISFLPKKMIVNHYPFLLVENEYLWQVPFTATTDNPELLEWFRNLPTENGTYTGEIDDDTNKVLRYLQGNLIDSISTEKQRFDPVTIPMPIQAECGCSLCLHRAFRFKELMDVLSEGKNADEPALKRALVHYRMGQYAKAFKVLEDFSKQALESKQFVSYFIAQFNMVQLGKLVKYENDGTTSEFELIARSEDIDLDKIYTTYVSRSNRDILLWIKDLSFVEINHKRIERLLNQIRDNFYSRSGGWNTHTRELLNVFQEMLCFLEYNHVIYGRDHAVREVTRMFLEGLFASYGSNSKLGGKLIHFGDNLLEKLAINSNTKDISDMYKRYDLSNLRYIGGEDGGSIFERFADFVNGYDGIAETFKDFDNEGRLDFWSNYRRIFNNFLTLFAILDIKEQELDHVVGTLMPFLKIQQHFNESQLSVTLRYFINQKGKELTNAHLEELFFFILTTDTLDNRSLIDLISRIMGDRNQTLTYPAPLWKEIQNHYLINDCLKDNHGDIEIICTIYDLTTSTSKRAEISRFIKHFLKAGFVDEVYYVSAMYDVIDFNKSLHAKYMSTIALVIGKGKGVTVFRRKDFYNDGRVDGFVNYMAKFKLAIDPEWKTHIMGLDHYYKWLLDMEQFDYSGFNPEWPFNYYTKYYKEMYKNSDALKVFLRKYCRDTSDVRMLKFYLDLFVE